MAPNEGILLQIQWVKMLLLCTQQATALA